MTIVNTTIVDMVPKYIMNCLVLKTEAYITSGEILSLALDKCDDDSKRLEEIIKKNDVTERRIQCLLEEQRKVKEMQDVILDTTELDRP